MFIPYTTVWSFNLCQDYSLSALNSTAKASIPFPLAIGTFSYLYY